MTEFVEMGFLYLCIDLLSAMFRLYKWVFFSYLLKSSILVKFFGSFGFGINLSSILDQI